MSSATDAMPINAIETNGHPVSTSLEGLNATVPIPPDASGAPQIPDPWA